MSDASAWIAVVGTLAGAATGAAMGASFSVAIGRRDHARRKRDRLAVLHGDLALLRADLALLHAHGFDFARLRDVAPIPQLPPGTVESRFEFVVPESDVTSNLFVVATMLSALDRECAQFRANGRVRLPLARAELRRLESVAQQHLPAEPTLSDDEEFTDPDFLHLVKKAGDEMNMEAALRGADVDRESATIVRRTFGLTLALSLHILDDMNAEIGRILQRPLPHVIPSWNPDEASPPGWG